MNINHSSININIGLSLYKKNINMKLIYYYIKSTMEPKNYSTISIIAEPAKLKNAPMKSINFQQAQYHSVQTAF